MPITLYFSFKYKKKEPKMMRPRFPMRVGMIKWYFFMGSNYKILELFWGTQVILINDVPNVCRCSSVERNIPITTLRYKKDNIKYKLNNCKISTFTFSLKNILYTKSSNLLHKIFTFSPYLSQVKSITHTLPWPHGASADYHCEAVIGVNAASLICRKRLRGGRSVTFWFRALQH